MASFAISKFSLENLADVKRLISHVHQYNKSPLRLMKRLGFKCFGAEIPPPEYVEGMRKNKNGEVIGFLFVFWKKFYIDMSRFFNELDVKNGFKIRLKDGSHVKVRFDLLEGTKWDSFTRTIKILSKESSFQFIHKCNPCLKKSVIAWAKAFFT